MHDGLHQIHRRRAAERGDKDVVGLVEQLHRAVDLLQDPPADHRNPVGHCHGLNLVVGDVEGCDAYFALQLGDLGPHLHPELGVEIRQGLVEQENPRAANDGPAHCHPLPLTARQLCRTLVELAFHLEDAGRLMHPLPDLGLGPLRELQREGDLSNTFIWG